MDFIRTYNMRFSEERTFADCIMDAPFLVRRFFLEICTTDINVLVRNYRLLLTVFTAFLYVLSPFDLIPEIVFGFIGLLDDFVVIIAVLIVVAQGFRQVLQDRN